ncbi:hypothetical protein FN846DRAFT_203481 [Sphaerosporella brunnea]|uniref:Uncharacterized protein n=1 Tax=Sphaerosporella brunnea TaxID=1250544 RepID=A0A5J5F7R5_9PEZI|nr:hypothetical protein FN846DRAFT_203481 [Sphaerosporella brunnea]
MRLRDWQSGRVDESDRKAGCVQLLGWCWAGRYVIGRGDWLQAVLEAATWLVFHHAGPGWNQTARAPGPLVLLVSACVLADRLRAEPPQRRPSTPWAVPIVAVPHHVSLSLEVTFYPPDSLNQPAMNSASCLQEACSAGFRVSNLFASRPAATLENNATIGTSCGSPSKTTRGRRISESGHVCTCLADIQETPTPAENLSAPSRGGSTFRTNAGLSNSIASITNFPVTVSTHTQHAGKNNKKNKKSSNTDQTRTTFVATRNVMAQLWTQIRLN